MCFPSSSPTLATPPPPPRRPLCARFDSSSSLHPFSSFLSLAVCPSPSSSILFCGARSPFVCVARVGFCPTCAILSLSLPHIMECRSPSSSSSSSLYGVLFDRQVCSFPRSPLSEDIHCAVIFAHFRGSQTASSGFRFKIHAYCLFAVRLGSNSPSESVRSNLRIRRTNTQ